MAIASKHTQNPVSWLFEKDSKKNLNKDISIQRREVWGAENKSNLIVSLLLDIPIESLLLESVSKTEFNVLDGKQRTLTICAFLRNEFELSRKIRVKELEGTPLVGKKFSDLPEEFQTRIRDYQLKFSIVERLSEDERALVFFMRNQSVALTKMDLTLANLGEKALSTLTKFSGHHFLAKKAKLTQPAREKHDDLRIVLQYLLLHFNRAVDFSGTALMSLCDDIKNEECEIPESELEAILDYLNEATPDKKQYLKLVHLPVIMYIANRAVEQDIKAGEFGAKLESFFANLKDDSTYMKACKSGSSKRANVQLRIKEMSEFILEK